MTQNPQQNPQQLPEDGSSSRPSAQVLPFEKPQTDLQRAVAARAQQSMERSRIKPRPKPLKWTLLCLVALVPVLLVFGAVDGLLRMFHQLNAAFSSQQPPAAEQPAVQQPVVQEAPSEDSTPGVVILQRPEE